MERVAAADRARASLDDALLERAARGDSAAFGQLIAPRLERCYRLAFAVLGNESDAADATQEAMVSAWRDLPRLRDHRSFDGWLNRIVANAARMGRRHRVRLREVAVPDERSGELNPEGRELRDPGGSRELDRVPLADAIGRAFGRLREHERVILALHYLEERPIAEIAATLAVPPGTVKSRLHAARAALERALEVEA